jgi:hypothetical protein
MNSKAISIDRVGSLCSSAQQGMQCNFRRLEFAQQYPAVPLVVVSVETADSRPALASRRKLNVISR